MVIFNSKETERTQQQKLRYDVSGIVSAVPSFFGDTDQFDSREPGLGERRKGKGSLMRVEKSEGGRKRAVWTQGQSGHLQQGRGKRQGGLGRDREMETGIHTGRHRVQAISSLWRISSVTERFQKQSELHRHRISFRGKTPAPSLNYISVAVEHPLLGLWEHRQRRLLAGLRGVG